jgi:hypothetical protein
VVVQAIAEQYLPRIDNPGGMELVVEDAAGDKYTLRFRYETRPSACLLCVDVGQKGQQMCM